MSDFFSLLRSSTNELERRFRNPLELDDVLGGANMSPQHQQQQQQALVGAWSDEEHRIFLAQLSRFVDPLSHINDIATAVGSKSAEEVEL